MKTISPTQGLWISDCEDQGTPVLAGKANKMPDPIQKYMTFLHWWSSQQKYNLNFFESKKFLITIP
jgi:hypothetical protein